MLTPVQIRCALIAAALIIVAPAIAVGQGLMVSAHGPVNRSMGGAATAAPLEGIGSIFWNPASITALPSSELGFGTALVLPELETSSFIPGLGGGSTRAEPGVTAIPTIGWVHQPECSPLVFGLGLYGAAGFRTNFPASTTNPIFTPQSNSPFVPGGLGRVYTEASFIEIIPTLAYRVNDNFSIGVGPTLTLGELIIDPLMAIPPDDADGSFWPRYPSGRGVRTHWGGGVQLGAYYESESGVHLGATWKSPQWMETFRFNTENELGLPVVGHFDLDLPMIVSVGAAYSGFEKWLFSTDLRYYDYENTDGFRNSGFNPDFSVAGLGWKSVFALATGVQYEVNEDLYLRGGYTFNENPIPDSLAMFNVPAPLFYQHEFHIGTSKRLCKQLWLNLAYSYFLENEISGPIVHPLAGPIPGSRVSSQMSAHVLDVGLTLRY